MARRKKLLEWEAPPAPRACEAPDCEAPGAHRAPKSRERLGQYHWFCVEHVREYNATWNFFEGMDRADIENFRTKDIVGHRPTWPLGFGSMSGTVNSIRDHFHFFSQEAANTLHGTNGVSGRQPKPEERQALAELELEPETTVDEIKSRYKELVKRHHPDLNGGDKKSEERLKNVNKAYAVLMSCGYG